MFMFSVQFSAYHVLHRTTLIPLTFYNNPIFSLALSFIYQRIHYKNTKILIYNCAVDLEWRFPENIRQLSRPRSNHTLLPNTY